MKKYLVIEKNKLILSHAKSVLLFCIFHILKEILVIIL